jgi:hypothetical protein
MKRARFMASANYKVEISMFIYALFKLKNDVLNNELLISQKTVDDFTLFFLITKMKFFQSKWNHVRATRAKGAIKFSKSIPKTSKDFAKMAAHSRCIYSWLIICKCV